MAIPPNELKIEDPFLKEAEYLEILIDERLSKLSIINNEVIIHINRRISDKLLSEIKKRYKTAGWSNVSAKAAYTSGLVYDYDFCTTLTFTT